jgi:hypothetical protein
MFQDYKVAYSEKGDTHKEEAESTITVGWLLRKCNFLFLLFRYVIMSFPGTNTKAKCIRLIDS